MSKTCYTPVKGLDDVIASKVTGWNKYLVANLRGLYQERNTEAETPTAETLVEFRRSLSKEDAKRILDAVYNPAVSYTQLRDDFSAEERFNRISMISTMFSDIVDAVQEENPNVSRRDIVAGFTIDGQQVGGVAGIFNEIYDTLQSQYSDAIQEGNSEVATKYQKIFDNWGALLSFAKIRIREAEDIKIGQDISFADDANPNNFNDNDMTEKFIMEESKREGWMEQAEFESSFGSIGKQVRKVIGRTPQYKDGQPVLDDLGFPVMQDPVRMHQELLDVLRGVGSETEMMNALREYSSTAEWVSPFMEELENPLVRTQFYTDFKKNFQPYAMQTEKQDGRIKTYKTALLNRIKGNKPFSSFLTSVKLGKVVNPTRSIFEKSGPSTRVMPVRVERIRNKIIDTLKQPERITEKSKFWQMSKVERKQFLIDAIESLGIDIDGETLDRIMSKNKDVRALNKELLDAAKFGLTLTKEEQEGRKDVSYEELIKRASSNEKKGVLREKITKILAIVAKSREGLKLESRIRYGDNTFFSNVIPSFMGDKFDRIASFVKATDKRGLQAMLETTYLDSSYFQYNGKILNKWIEELYNSDLSKEDNFAANFTFKRFLGTDKLTFDDFTSKQHAVQMLNEYFSERQISPNSQYAWYPVFILGDSGVAKFIKAKRYSGQEILDGLYNVYVQEKRRMELTKAANRKMQEEGIKAIDNFSKNEDKFSLLPFLNEPKYAGMIKEGNLEQSVKQAIRAYMDDATTKFKQQLNNLGVLEQAGNQYVYLSQEVKGDRTIDQVLADYYWNTKFATIQQLQMMTIDPSFYKGTKDLQKRYKEIHAPGSALSVEAIDPFTGERYSNDGIERVVYFDDIDVNAEKFDPEFMAAIANHFGKNSNVYKSYKKNTLTDGQGYRTLESYKKVMGMAGKWDERMEAAYNQIQSIRSKIGKDENPSMEDIKSISDLAVIFQPIKPYLFSFENYSINGADMLKIPVQHKYAEAVLIPELLPAGSKLRDIAYWMEEHVNPETGKSEPIDMIGSTKIVKVGGFGSTDIANATHDNIDEYLNKGYVHQLSYADYRIQTNVPEHINSSQLFGTQVRKLIMAKVERFKDYSSYIGGKRVNLGGKYGNVKLNGGNLVRFYNSLITANIIDSYHLFENAVSDAGKISNRLIQTTANNSRESKDNIMAYSLNAKGEFTIPLFEGGLEHDSSALFFSLFKKMVNKQSIKGGSAVQVSAMGITGYEEDGGLRYVIDPNNPNNILYAECEIPWDLTYTDNAGKEHALDFGTYCNEDGTLKVDADGNTLLEKTYPNILSLLAYRIPTERDYSMINLRVKRFSHKTAGGTIKVPPQGTTIAGFDFDIDKLYFMRNEYQQRQLTSEEIKNIWSEFYDTYPNLKAVLKEAREEDTESLDRLYKYWEKAGLPYTYQAAFNQFVADRGYIKFEEYDFSKSPLENSKASRNNMLIHLIQQRLSDVETFGDRYTPGGFSNASKAARVMRELMFGNVIADHNSSTVDLSSINRAIDEGKLEDPEPNYDPSDPMTIVTYNQQNNVAGKLIGIFANQNTNHAFASLMEEFYLKEAISFAGKTYADLLHNSEIDTSLNVAEFLAASVDAVKDPVLNFLNLNTITADAGAMLARLGFTTEDIGLLFNQPIIKDICEYSFNNGMSDINSVIDNVLDTYEVEGELNKAIPEEFDKEQLAYNIVRSANEDKEDLMRDDEFVERQIHVADLFRKILEASNDVSQFVRNTKFTASNAVGSTFGDAYAQQMKVAAYVKSFKKADALKVEMKVAQGIYSPINNEGSTLAMSDQEYMESLLENPFAYEQAMYDMNRKAEKVINKFYPYNTKAYTEAREGLAGFTRSGLLDAETINSIHSDLMVFMLSQQENSLFNGSMPITVNESIKVKDSGGISLSSTGYKKGDPQRHPDVNYVFTENAEAYIISTGIPLDKVPDFPNQGRTKLNVSDEGGTNQAGIRTDSKGNISPNAYGIVVKKYQQDVNGRFVAKEGQFQDTNDDFNLFVRLNEDMFKRLSESSNKKIVLPTQIGLGKAALPLRFVKWLQQNLYTRFNIESTIERNLNSQYDGYGLSLKSVSTKVTYKNTVTAREYFTEVFPEGLFNILEANPTMKSMPIFQYMQFQTDEKTGKVSMNIQDIGGLAPYQKDELKESWGDLMRNENTAEIAQSLFLYNYYKLGFTYSPMAFMNLAPTEVKLAVQVGYDYNGNPQSYVDFLNEVQKSRIGVNSQEFAKQYLLNHLDNTRLVLHPKGRSGKIISNLAFEKGVAVNSFTLNAKKLGKDANPFLLPSEDKGIDVFRPVIVIDDVAYMCNNGGDIFNQSTTGSMDYFRVDALGDAGKSLQYSSNGITTSMVADTEVQDNGNTSVEPEVVSTPDTSLTTEELIKEATDLALKADNTLQRDMVVEMLSKAGREDLIDTINSLKAQANNVTDQEGNKIC